MRTDTLELLPPAPGLLARLTVHRFGSPGRGPKAVIQAALHADEVPALLVAHHLKPLLQAAEAEGRLRGEVLLLPAANPLGLGQQLLGQHHGRFHLADGLNFNRFVPDLTAAVASAIEGRLGADAQANGRVVRQALAAAAAALQATEPAADLKRRLLQLAADADIVLDLHCDSEAVMHLYALTPQADIAAELGALLGAQAVLLATESGDSPFDEACSTPWLQLAQRVAPRPLPLGCFATTVELRGQADTHHAQAAADAAALMAFLARRGVVEAPPVVLPPARCQPTPLAGSEPLAAPHAGVVVFHRAPGDRVLAGEHVADVVCPVSGQVTPVCSGTTGLLYARTATRWAAAGTRLAKVAGATATRSGKLLSA
jgi:predicted deacylase